MELKEIERHIGLYADEKLPTSTYFKLQCQRHLQDMQRLKEQNWRFDAREAEKHTNFLQHVARHTSDRWAGKPFDAQPFQLIMVYMLFGWQAFSEDTDGFVRRYTTLLFDIARKNGKTELIAAIANDMFVNSMFGTEIYCTATVKDQAQKTFKSISAMMHFMMKHSASLRRRVKRNKLVLELPKEDSLLKPLSSDYNSLDGLNPLMAVIDEFHAHKTSYVYDVMESGQGSRWDGPILAVTTTAGFDKNYPCYEFRRNAIDVLNGTKTDNNLLPFIFAMDPDDDWQDESMWYKSNPNLGVSVSLEFLRSRWQKAFNEGPTKQRQFQTKNLNMWVDSETVWIERSTWKRNASITGRKYEILRGKKCFGALDISAVKDMTSFAMAFPIQEGLDRPHLITYHFIPEARAHDMQRRGYHHMEWVKDGWLSATSGNVIDYEAVQQTILQCKKDYKLKKIAFDRWGANNIVDALTTSGLEFMPHGQGFGDMNEPSKAFERDVYADDVKIEHFNNPVLIWQIGNAVVKMDPAGNIKPDKEKATRQIDGIVASIMAWGLMKTEEHNKNVYSSRGIRVVG